MLHFDTDYMEGAHPAIIDALCACNLEQTSGYGNDAHCANAHTLVRKALGDDSLDVHLLVGGTQTNSTVIDAVLKRNEGVLAAQSGHINVHESGAVEAWGHKILTLPSHQGRIMASELLGYLKEFYADDSWTHMVPPGMLYISFPTEYGTVYQRSELEEIHSICQEYHIPLFIDGARLGYGLACRQCDIELKDLPKLCEVFYIGGTKVGALFGECVVAQKGVLECFFPQVVKRHGALLAKGRLLGIQFETLFTPTADGTLLYSEISRHAVDMAMMLKQGFSELGYTPFIDSPTNQQFFTLPNSIIDGLHRYASFENWGAPGKDCSNVRFVTSWATEQENVQSLLDILKTIS